MAAPPQAAGAEGMIASQGASGGVHHLTMQSNFMVTGLKNLPCGEYLGAVLKGGQCKFFHTPIVSPSKVGLDEAVKTNFVANFLNASTVSTIFSQLLGSEGQMSLVSTCKDMTRNLNAETMGGKAEQGGTPMAPLGGQGGGQAMAMG